jgi:hypothetical protein
VIGRNGTVVNGLANAAATIGGVTYGLLVNTMSGNDVVSLDNVYTAGSIFILTGDGDDRVTLGAQGEVSPAGELDIDTGAGNDQVYELNYNVFVVGSNLIKLGNGFDSASVIGASATGGHYGSAFPLTNTRPSISISALDGQDNMLAVGLTARVVLSINGPGGSSIAVLNSWADGIHVTNDGGTTFLDTNYCAAIISIRSSGLPGAPDASVIVNRCHTAGVHIYMGRTNSFVSAYGNLMTGSYSSRAGEPGTVLTGLYVSAERAKNSEPPYQNRITVEATYNVVPRGSIHLGDGNDSLALIGNAIGGVSDFDVYDRPFDLDGFGGVNRIVDQGNSFDDVTLKNFAS